MPWCELINFFGSPGSKPFLLFMTYHAKMHLVWELDLVIEQSVTFCYL